ncbi:MAG TPA: aminotransferase class III-fold pyridoxal phosphate-dependent enzyme, partial [bacterium]|nr:aminotransferase class III-fold pyridoxal phosphate-dependent enzyme [bacterium]
PLVCAASLAVFEAIRKDGLLENTRRQGEYLKKKLEKISPLVREVRGRGLMLGMELKKPGAAVAARALELGLLINCTQGNVLRIMPPLTVTRRELDLGLKILKQALEEAA